MRMKRCMIYTVKSRHGGKGITIVDSETTRHTSTHPLLDQLPHPLTYVMSFLEEEGFEVWIVGGFVRDALRSVEPHDADLATNASWQDVKRLALKHHCTVFETGIKHGTITVIYKHYTIEITTFRSDGTYSDHRHPNSVSFVSSLSEDLARRDFTINAMAYHPKRGLQDPFNGQKDLENHIIRCVGDPRIRFQEDALRIMRALRFASLFGFTIETKTEQALFDEAPALEHISGQRIAAEIEKMLCGNNIRFILMTYTTVLSIIIPQLNIMKGFDQHSRWHVFDVLEHTAHVVEKTPPYPLVRWAALFHDSGKPDTFLIDSQGVGHMPGHPLASISHLKKAAKRLHFSHRRLHDLELLVRFHDERPSPTRESVCSLYAKLEENTYLFHVMCDLMRGDALGKAPSNHKRVDTIDAAEHLFDSLKEEGVCLSVRDLSISGADLIKLGVEKGPYIGLLLNEIFSAVVKGDIEETRDAMLSYARSLIDA